MEFQKIVKAFQEERKAKAVKCFHVQFSGTIEFGDLPRRSYYYLQYKIHAGDDWVLENGSVCGRSQISYSTGKSGCVWNLPIQAVFSSTNCSGWPRISLTIHKFDFLNRDVVYGYAAGLLPTKTVSCRTQGQQDQTREVFLELTAPQVKSISDLIIGAIKGKSPELRNSGFLVQDENRHLLRSLCLGRQIMLRVSVTTKGMKTLRYTL